MSSENSDFYHTIIDNNLFAPLGIVLNKKPKPGVNLQLIATFTTDDPLRSTAIVKNTATGTGQTVRVGDTIGDYSVLEIQAKQILIEKVGERAVWKRMSHYLLLY